MTEPITEARAREIATLTAHDDPTDYSSYTLTECALNEDGSVWWVVFALPPPTPPGGHFGVQVDAATGEATLMPGE